MNQIALRRRKAKNLEVVLFYKKTCSWRRSCTNCTPAWLASAKAFPAEAIYTQPPSCINIPTRSIWLRSNSFVLHSPVICQYRLVKSTIELHAFHLMHPCTNQRETAADKNTDALVSAKSNLIGATRPSVWRKTENSTLASRLNTGSPCLAQSRRRQWRLVGARANCCRQMASWRHAYYFRFAVTWSQMLYAAFTDHLLGGLGIVIVWQCLCPDVEWTDL